MCKNILVAEDNDDTRELLVHILTTAGYAVRGAANGAEALNKLEQVEEETLVLLDLMMPVMDGWAFLKDSRRRNHKVITISAVYSGTLEEVSDWPGVDGKMQKPLFAADLLSVVAKFCDLRA